MSESMQEQRLRETLEAERAAGAAWAQIAGEATVRVKELRRVLEDISQLPGNLSARVIADAWLDVNPAKRQDA